MPHVPSEDMDMTTKTVTENMSSTEAIQTPKRFGLQLYIRFLHFYVTGPT